MKTDCKLATGFSALAETLKPLTAKSMALSMALFLGACASTGDKPADTGAADDVALEQQTEQPTSEDPAPTAAELMKTLQAPLKEPEPLKKQEIPAKAATESKKETVEKAAEKKVDTSLSKKTASKEIEQQPAPVAKVPVATAAAVKQVTEQKALVEAKASEAAEKTEVSVEKKPVVQVVSSTGATPFSVGANQLPFSYDIWTIRKGNTPLTQGLVITTPTWEMGKEGYMSQIWLTLMEDKIHVNSSSDIETASRGLGIRIDEGELIPFTTIAEANIAVIEGRWLDRLARANKIDIYLGFLPGKKPTSDTFNSDLSLNNLARIVATYRILNQ